MAHFVELNSDNFVIHCIRVVDDIIDNTPFPQSEEMGIVYCKSLYGEDTIWKQTSYNNNFRKMFATINYFYDHINDIFVRPKRFQSWIYNYDSKLWDPPVPHPLGFAQCNLILGYNYRKPDPNQSIDVNKLNQDYPIFVWSEENLNWIETEKPYPSFIPSEDGYFWVAPVLMTNKLFSKWDEETQSYIKNEVYELLLNAKN